MATVWIKAIHSIGGKNAGTAPKSIAKILRLKTDYAANEKKTDDGRLVRGYACDPRVADEQFLLAKREYDYLTGRTRGKHDILAYHIRQAFKPGEITPELANALGYQMAMSFFKGNHAFIVATHIDKHHIHNHIIANSTTLDCLRKFKDFKRSDLALRRISDLLCLENGLSIVENPKPSKGRNYGEWLGDKKPPSHKQILQQAIDEILPSASAYDDFIERLIAAGFDVSTKRKHHTAKRPDWGKPTRIDTLGDDYTIEMIMSRLGVTKVRGGNSDSGVKTHGAVSDIRVSLLVDIQAKLQEGKGAGYEQWAHIFNVKQMAKTLLFLKENGIDSYEDLKKKSSSASGDFAVLTKRIKEIETRQKEIAELQKYIGQYGKTRDVYEAYRKSGGSSKFYEEHTAEIILHRAAKKYFDGLGQKKLPSINQLKQEYAALADERRKLYSGYHELKEKSRGLATAVANADRILGVTPQAQTRETSRDETR
jgi:hypothetical protein